MTKARDIADGVDTADIADGAISTAKLADGSINATKIDVSGNGTAGQFLSSDGDGTMTWADAGGGFDLGTALTGTTPTIDWSSATAFSHTLTGDTTYSFSNVPSGGEVELFLKNVGKQKDVLSFSNETNGLNTSSGTGGSAVENYSSTFNNDGTKFYVVGNWSSSWRCAEFDLSTAYDISTATFNHSAPTSSDLSLAITFNGDGTKLIGIRTNGVFKVFNLSTAYDITTIPTTASTTVDINSTVFGGLSSSGTYGGGSGGRLFNSDGTKLFYFNSYLYANTSNPSWWILGLSTPYDITSTITIESQTSNITTTTDLNMTGNYRVRGALSGDGKTVAVAPRNYVSSTTDWAFARYDMTEAFNANTASLTDTTTHTLTAGNTQIDDLGISADDNWMYYQENNNRGVYRVSDISGDYQVTFPSSVSALPTTLGDGDDPATTSYLRMVSIDGTNVLITDSKEIS
jgi:hypothetical protein